MVGVWVPCGMDEDHPMLSSDGEYITGANQHGLNLFRVQADEIIGTHVASWVDYQYRQLIDARLKIFNARHDYADELPVIQLDFIRRDGTKFRADLHVRWVAEHVACGVYSRIVELGRNP